MAEARIERVVELGSLLRHPQLTSGHQPLNLNITHHRGQDIQSRHVSDRYLSMTSLSSICVRPSKVRDGHSLGSVLLALSIFVPDAAPIVVHDPPQGMTTMGNHQRLLHS